MKTIADYMTKDVITVSGEASVLDTIRLMRKKHVSSILVKEGEDAVGIFTERDIMLKPDYASPDKLRTMKIKTLMTEDLKTAAPDESYISVMESMQKHRIRHMPVVEDGCIVGMVSLRDLLNNYHENLEMLLEQTVAALSSAAEKRDPYTAGHQERVTHLACAIAQEMGIPDREISGIRMAAFIHDIGKLYIPAEILSKPGKLSDAEFNLIKIHPQIGYDILKGINFPWPIAQIVLQHHEKVNGTGYPTGLTGDDILVGAKIITVADVTEAMSSHRPYRPSRGMPATLKEIRTNKGILYDSAAVDACVKLLVRKKWTFPKTSDSNFGSPA